MNTISAPIGGHANVKEKKDDGKTENKMSSLFHINAGGKEPTYETTAMFLRSFLLPPPEATSVSFRLLQVEGEEGEEGGADHGGGHGGGAAGGRRRGGSGVTGHDGGRRGGGDEDGAGDLPHLHRRRLSVVCTLQTARSRSGDGSNGEL